MAPDIRRRILRFAFIFFPLLSWLGTAMHLSGVHPKGITWRHLSHWLTVTPTYLPLIIAPCLGLCLAVALAITLKRYAHTDGYDGAGYKKHLRGTEVVPYEKLQKKCRQRFRKQLNVAGIPMPTSIETLHLMINGATGSGKSVLLRPLLLSALKRGDRAVIVDPNGDFFKKFGRPGDIILNPYDARTVGWSFFNEIRADYDWQRLALSIVPLGVDPNAEEWNGYARLLLKETAKKLFELGTPDIDQLFRWTTMAPHDDLKEFLRGTNAESLFAGSSEASKALTSSRFVLSKYLERHTDMPAGIFSIRDWMETGTGSLYITWREDMKVAMKPLVSSWVDIFCSTILSMPENLSRRWQLSIDELASLEKLPSLVDLLTKGRKHGVGVVAGLQTVSQLDDIYGKQLAQTLRACFRSLVVLGGSKTDPETAEEMSKALGEHEVLRPEYTDSRNPGSSRNTSERMVRSTERVVTPAQIQTLPDLTGYIAFAGNRPISKFKLEVIDFKDLNEPFQDAQFVKVAKRVHVPAGLPEDPTQPGEAKQKVA